MAQEIPQTGPWLNFSFAQRWTFLSVLFLVGVSTSMDRTILSIVLEQLKEEFELSDIMLGLLGGAPFGVCYALSSIPLARLADRYGSKIVLGLSAVAWSVMTAVCGLATTLPFLILARMGVGFAEGGSYPPSHALIAGYFSPERRGLALAVFTASGTFGSLVASALGGWVADTHGWRMAFIVMAALSAPVGLLVLGVLKEPLAAARATVRAKSSTFWSDLAVLARKNSYVAVLAALFFYSMLPFGVIVFTPTFMVRLLDLDLAQAGALFGLALVIGTPIGSLIGGLTCDYLRKRDERWLIRAPAIILSIDVFVAASAYLARDVQTFLILHALNTALLYATLPCVFAAVQHVCGSARRATATAAMFAVFNALGIIIAPLLVGGLSDAFGSWAQGESLRYALVATCFALAPAALLLWWAVRFVPVDRED